VEAAVAQGEQECRAGLYRSCYDAARCSRDHVEGGLVRWFLPRRRGVPSSLFRQRFLGSVVGGESGVNGMRYRKLKVEKWADRTGLRGESLIYVRFG